MLQPLSTLPISKAILSEFSKTTCLYVEDVRKSQDLARKCDPRISRSLPTTESALDVWQEELRCDCLTTLCKSLDDILQGGFQCKSITEIYGAFGSGKTQICLQLSIMSQLPKICGGLDGETLYIDTRNGFSPTRIQDMIKGCQKLFPDESLNPDEILKGIKVASPQSLDDLLSVIQCLKNHLAQSSKIRVVIIDSLSLPVQCSQRDGGQRTEFYFHILDELQEISIYHNVAVIIVNELRSHIDIKGQIVYASAGGELVAHRVHKRLLVARLNDFTFAAKVSKSPLLPQISVLFNITENGIRDNVSKP